MKCNQCKKIVEVLTSIPKNKFFCDSCSWNIKFANNWYRKLWYTNLMWKWRKLKKTLTKRIYIRIEII